MASRVRRGSMDTADGPIYYEVAGTGHPLVLIHAGIVDRRQWEREFRSYADQYRVLRYDVRGYGKSPAGRRPYSDSDDLSLLLSHLDMEKVRIVGVSNGGRIALDYAARFPHNIEAIVAVAAILHGFQPTDPEAIAAFEELERREKEAQDAFKSGDRQKAAKLEMGIWAHSPTSENRKLVATMIEENLKAALDESSLSLPASPPTSELLPQLRAPVLLVEAEKDHPAVHYPIDWISERLPTSRRVTISGADHLANLSRPDEFDHRVLDFLE